MLASVAYAPEAQPEGLVIGLLGSGPMETSRSLIGIEKLARMMYKKPELVHKAFKFLTEFHIAVAKLWAEKFDPARMAEFFPDHIALGNLEPTIVQTQKPLEVYEATRDLVVEHKDIAGGFSYSTGCEMPPMAPAGCVWAMTKAVKEFGWYE